MKSKTSKTKRNLLALTLLGSAGLFFSSITKRIFPSASKEKESKTFITSDGKLVNVEVHNIPDFSESKPVNRTEFENWMNNKKS